MQWWQQWKEYVKYDVSFVVIELLFVLNGGKYLFGIVVYFMEQVEDRIGSSFSYVNIIEEKFLDNIFIVFEVLEIVGSGFLYFVILGVDVCFV